MPLLIRNGDIVTADSRCRADIYCEHETITRIGRDLDAPPGTEIIDAAGKYVFPGFIDPHTHIYLPFMGTFSKDTYETASVAALIGGTTTLFDMCIPAKSEEPAAAFDLWKSKSTGRSACDYSFHLGITRYDEASERQVREIVAAGIASFKVFLAYKGAFGVSDEELYRALRLARSLGVITTAHCENETLVAERQKELIAAGNTAPRWHEPSRPTLVEAEGVHHLLTFATATGAHVYIVHTSCREAVEAARRFRDRGVPVWIETLIQYLTLDSSYAEQPGFEGAKYVMSPPLRGREHQEALWSGLRTGLISTVATDHAPFDFATQKLMGCDDFSRIPNGIPSLEARINLLYTHGIAAGRLDLHRFVDVASTQAAKIFGLFPRKGTIACGADADLVVYDPQYRGTISAKTQHMNVDYSAFEGFEISGRPAVVTLRGQVMVREGEFVGDATRGQLLKREPTHHPDAAR